MSALLIGPAAFLMGIPLPTGIRVVNEKSSHLISIAWGTNACSSTFGSIASVMISVAYGYRVTFFVAAVVYVAAWFFLKRMMTAKAVSGKD